MSPGPPKTSGGSGAAGGGGRGGSGRPGGGRPGGGGGRRRPGRGLIVAIVVVILVAAIAAGVLLSRAGASGDSAPSIEQALALGQCSPVEYNQEGRDADGNRQSPHIQTLDSPHAPYTTSPPVWGPHFNRPVPAAIYPTKLRDEQITHNIEHGMVEIRYRPDAPPEQIQAIRQFVTDNPTQLVMEPDPDVKAPTNVTYVAWENLTRCNVIDPETLRGFYARFANKAPESGLVPQDG